ncbi:MAG: FtsQ-type POTRA domain-containing protein [Clostridia bacterium]|nr:FtsQ-type POTRA domain-containing protein [Clostridia bacterium]
MAKPQRGNAPQKSKEELRREQRDALEQKKHRRHALLVIGLVALTVLVVAILSVTVFFKVSTVEVDASRTQYKAEQIRQASGIENGESLLLLKRDEVCARVSEQLPFTGTITVKRSLPGKVKIAVTDSEIEAAVRYNDQYYVLNDENKVLAKVGSIDSLNDLAERQAKLAKARKKKAKPTTTVKSEKTGDKKTTEAETTTTTTTTTTAADPSLSTTAANAIAGGEDLDKAADDLTVILGVKVKEGKVGRTLVASNAEVFRTYNDIMRAMELNGIKEITLVDLSKVSDIKLRYQKRIDILLGSAAGLERKAALCAKVLEEQNKISTEQKGIIDLSIEGKAYFSEGGATTRTTTMTTLTLPMSETSEADPNAPTTAPGETTGTTSGTGTTTAAGTGDASTTETTTTNDPADIGG